MAVAVATQIASIKLVMEGAMEDGAPGAKAGAKPPKRSAAELKKFRQEQIASQPRAKGGFFGSGRGPTVGGQPKGSLVKTGGDSSKMVGMAKTGLKQGAAMAKGAAKTAGIQAGVASILKQSQLFTGVIGTIFQIDGMLVDVAIMPFMPIIIPVIKLLAWTVPKFMWYTSKLQIGVQFVVDMIGWFFGKVGDGIGWIINSKWVQAMVEGVKTAAMAVWKWVSNPSEWWSGPLHPVKGFFEIIKGIIDSIVEIIQSAWSIAQGIIQGIWDFGKSAYDGIKEFISGIWDGLKTWAAGLWKNITDFVATINAWLGKLGTFLLDLGKTVIDFIVAPFTLAWDGIQALWEIFKAAFDSASEFVKGIPDKIWGFIQSIWDTISGWADTFVNALVAVKDWTVGIFQKIKDFFSGIWDTTKEWFSTAKQWIIDKIKEWAANFIDAIIAVKDWTVGIFKNIKDFFSGAWNTAKEWFTTARQWVWDKITDFASGFVSAIITVKDWTTRIFSKIKVFFNSVWDTAKNWFFTAKENIKEFFIGVWSTAKNWFLDRVTSVKNFFTGIWDKASELITFIKEIGSKIFNKIDTIRQKIVNIIATINPLNWIPQIVQKMKDIIPSPGDLMSAVPGAGAVGNVLSKAKFWQHGGIVTRPTLGIAGEHGPEAIIPLRNLTRQSLPPPTPVNITVINRTPEGKESQEVFMITRHQERNQNFEFEIQQHPLLGAGGL